MARKKHEPEKHENLERWMVSYADFITLLFAFFVVMYAISSVNEGKYKMLSNSIGIAFGGTAPVHVIEQATPVSGTITPLPNRKERALLVEIRREREKMTTIGHDLISILSPLIQEGKVRVIQTPRGVNVEINASVLFPTAGSQLSPQSAQVLKAVGQVLKGSDNVIQVEGFTDNLPINTPSYPSNWELSAMRASSVVRLLIESGIDENRLVAIGRGANQPIESNDTPEGRARNRRVQLMVLSGIPEETREVALKEGAEAQSTTPQPVNQNRRMPPG